MWETIKYFIRKVFGRVTSTNDEDGRLNEKAAREYADISDINFTAIFANKLANLTVTESNVNVTDGNKTSSKRAELLDRLINDVWTRAKDITSIVFGTGGVVLIPYSSGGKIYTDIVPQCRFFINSMRGDEISQASVLADIIKRDGNKYCRWSDYELRGDVYIIRSRATRNGEIIPLAAVPEWAQITEEIQIGNVNQMLFAYLKSPTHNRKTSGIYGVNITYGAEKIIEQIKECLRQIQIEFYGKQARIFADDTLFDKDDKIDSNIFKKLIVDSRSDVPFFEVFSPDIRESSYYARLAALFELLEKAVGTSKGILTEPTTAGATATEIKRSMYDTYALIENMRRNWENALQQLVYAFDVLAEFYGLTPSSEYSIATDWSYALIESSAETWGQITEGFADGVISKAELRQFIRPGETIDEAQAVVEEIEKSEPKMKEMIGD